MEVKVQCPCGTHYQFDVEPVEGRMPVTVACPECQADGTGLANSFIQQQLNPAPAAAPAQAAKPGLSLKRQHEPPPPAPAPAPAPASPAPASTFPPPAPGTPSQFPNLGSTKPVVQANAVKAKPEGNFTLGLIGTVVAGFVSMMLWYGLIKLTGFEIGYAAVGVGLLTGLGARIFVPNGNFVLGLVAATCAFIAIIGGEYLMLRDGVARFINKMSSGVYEARMSFARQAAEAQTDDQVRAVLIRKGASHGEKLNAASFTADDLKQFREKEQPELRDFVNGKPSKAEFVEQQGTKIMGGLSQWEMMKHSVGIFTALWLIFGVGAAYRIASNEGDDD